MHTATEMSMPTRTNGCTKTEVRMTAILLVWCILAKTSLLGLNAPMQRKPLGKRSTIRNPKNRKSESVLLHTDGTRRHSHRRIADVVIAQADS